MGVKDYRKQGSSIGRSLADDVFCEESSNVQYVSGSMERLRTARRAKGNQKYD
jgi:hypothetical protein